MLSWRVGVPHGAYSGAGDSLAPALAARCPVRDVPWVLHPSWVPHSPASTAPIPQQGRAGSQHRASGSAREEEQR